MTAAIHDYSKSMIPPALHRPDTENPEFDRSNATVEILRRHVHATANVLPMGSVMVERRADGRMLRARCDCPGVRAARTGK
jgi:hypothetical protein